MNFLENASNMLSIPRRIIKQQKRLEEIHRIHFNGYSKTLKIRFILRISKRNAPKIVKNDTKKAIILSFLFFSDFDKISQQIEYYHKIIIMSNTF